MMTVEYGSGSGESIGLEHKGAVRRLSRVQEPGHLMRLACSHLSRQSRET